MNIPSINLWIAGTVQSVQGHTWSLRGVYTSEEKAKAVCTGRHDFYAPANVDDLSGDEDVQVFEGIVFPNRIKE
jgi:hypothetical protein